MNHAKAIGRLSILAVGLGIGIGTAATAAAAPTVPVDPVPVVPDLAVAAAAPAAPIDFTSIAISFDGMSLFQSGTATAETGTGTDFAIAIGDHSFAEASDGNLNFADAVGNDSTATAGGHGTLLGNEDIAAVVGNDTVASAGWIGGDTTGNNDLATVYDPSAVVGSISFAGDGNLDFGGIVGDNILNEFATGGDSLYSLLGMGL